MAAKALRDACKVLVKKVKAISARNSEARDQVDHDQMPAGEL